MPRGRPPSRNRPTLSLKTSGLGSTCTDSVKTNPVFVTTESCNRLIEAIYMQAVEDYGRCLRAKSSGKERLNDFGYVDQEMERIEKFLIDNLGYSIGKKLINHIVVKAPEEKRGSGWPRKKRGDVE